MPPLTSEISGKSKSHLENFDSFGKTWLVHREVKEPLAELSRQAKEQGFELTICSAFRDFERQLNIWNAKANGQRTILDSQGKPLDPKSLSKKDLAFAILRWSALPGTSRHHWGTDFDVYDRLAVPSDYKVSLTPDEVQPGGPFAPLHEWLDRSMEQVGFFRPYHEDRGGVCPERWHLSYFPIANEFSKKLNQEKLREILQNEPLALKETVLANLDEIMHRFVQNVNTPPTHS